MIERLRYTLLSDLIRGNACEAIRKAIYGSRVEIKGPQRTVPQNNNFWGTMQDLADQVSIERVDGVQIKLTKEQWRDFCILMVYGSDRHQLQVLGPNGEVIDIGRPSSSDLSVEEMLQVQEFATYYGTINGVTFFFDRPRDAA